MEKEIKLCNKHLDEFKQKTKGLQSETRGMTKSETLLICSVIKSLNVKNVVESGRARGFSTQILASMLSDKEYKITSIDFDSYGEDTKYSEEVLKDYNNINLVYGDSNQLISRFITEPTVAIIDGPKGEDAILLATKIMIKYSELKAVFIHDLSKDVYERSVAKSIFPNIIFADNQKFIKNFTCLDSNKDKNRSHIALVYNKPGAIDKQVFNNFIKYKTNNDNIVRKFIKRIVTHNPFAYNLYIQTLKIKSGDKK